jgi:hypothetical protein
MSETINSRRLLWAGFLRSYERFPEHVAIDVAGHEVTYQQLAAFYGIRSSSAARYRFTTSGCSARTSLRNLDDLDIIKYLKFSAFAILALPFWPPPISLRHHEVTGYDDPAFFRKLRSTVSVGNSAKCKYPFNRKSAGSQFLFIVRLGRVHAFQSGYRFDYSRWVALPWPSALQSRLPAHRTLVPWGSFHR